MSMNIEKYVLDKLMDEFLAMMEEQQKELYFKDKLTNVEIAFNQIEHINEEIFTFDGVDYSVNKSAWTDVRNDMVVRLYKSLYKKTYDVEITDKIYVMYK